MKDIFQINKIPVTRLVREDVLRLAGPVIAEQALIMSMGIVNTIMAAHLGKEAISAIGMVDSINMVFLAVLASLATGGTVVIAHYVGQGSMDKANHAAKQALYSGVLIAAAITLALFFFRRQLIQFLYGAADKLVIENSLMYLKITLFTYPLMSVLQVGCGVLRGAGDTRTPMKVTVLMNFINVALTYLLINGMELRNATFHFDIPALGVRGAALGIAIARSLGALMIMVPLLRGSKLIRISGIFPVKIDLETQKYIFNIGLPAGVEALMHHGGRLLVQVFVVGMGTVSIASNQIVGSIVSFINIPAQAISIAAPTIVGQSLGRGDTGEAKKLIIYVTKLATSCYSLTVLIAFPLVGWIVSLYTPDKQIIEMSVSVLKEAFVACALFWSGAFVLPAALRGAGDAKFTMVTSIFGMWVFRIVFAYFVAVNMKLGVRGIWMGMYADWVVRTALYYIRYKKDQWKGHLVVGKQAEA